jgi:hypothetical protein
MRFWLRLSVLFSIVFIDSLWLLPTSWLIGLPLYALSGQYKGRTRHVSSSALYWLALRNGLLILLPFS